MTAAIFAVDSSCMVAAVCAWHERHAAAAAAIETRFDRGQRLVVPAHALAEAYAVLTRLPAPHRLAPKDAWIALKASFVDGSAVVALDAASYVATLSRLASEDLGGGRCYDEIIAASAASAGIEAILTLNPKHFDRVGATIAVVEP